MKLLKTLFEEIKSIPPFLDNVSYPTLNGLRGLSIVLVVFYHLSFADNDLYKRVFNGDLGVDIFFVLSGFLITTLNLKEKIKTSSIDLKKFYIRRVLRIFPVALLYILTVFILNFVFHLRIDLIVFLGAALFLYNISFFRNYPNGLSFGHFWSLATEEQFYFIFPVLLKKSYKLYLAIILFIVIVPPVCIYIQLWGFFPNTGLLSLFIKYLIKLNGIGCGCLFAILTFKNVFNNYYLSKFRFIINFVVFFILFYLKFESRIVPGNVLTNLEISLWIGFFISTNIIIGDDLIFRFFNNKIMMKVGMLSYSIYIWQQIFTFPILPKPFSVFPYNIFLISIISYISHSYYEKYFIKMKKKFSS